MPRESSPRAARCAVAPTLPSGARRLLKLVVPHESPRPRLRPVAAFDHCGAPGEARYGLNTSFAMTATGWDDTDLPLSYSFAYSSPRAGATSVMLSALRPDPTASATLPAGDEADGHILLVSVLCQNAFGAISAPVSIPVTVRAAPYRAFPTAALLRAAAPCRLARCSTRQHSCSTLCTTAAQLLHRCCTSAEWLQQLAICGKAHRAVLPITVLSVERSPARIGRIGRPHTHERAAPTPGAASPRYSSKFVDFYPSVYGSSHSACVKPKRRRRRNAR